MIITESEDKSMQELKKRIHENGIDYVLVGDYYVPKLKMPEEMQDEARAYGENRKIIPAYRTGREVIA